MVLLVLSDSYCRCDLFLPVGGWAATPGLPRAWCGPSAFMVEARWGEKRSLCPAGGLHSDRTEMDLERVLQCAYPAGARAEHSCCSHRSGHPAPPSEPPPCEREKVSWRTPWVQRQCWVLCCLSSTSNGGSSGCKRHLPWQEALLSVSSTPWAHAHQLAELRGGSVTHREQRGAQFFSAGSHF